MKKILLVSPSESFKERNTHLLQRSFFQLLNAASGKEALLLHEKDPVDIVICELLLPDMGGDDLCALLRESSGSETLSFILVCYDLPAEVERARTSSANSCLTKPVKPIQLLEAVGAFASANMLRHRRVPFSVKVTTQNDHTTFFCTAHDISLTGVLIETKEHLEIGDTITCNFVLPGVSSVEAECEITRYTTGVAGKKMYGLHFKELKWEYYSKIKQFIASMSSENEHDEG